MGATTCLRHGTVMNFTGKCFWCDREAERERLEASMERYDEADPDEIDPDEYGRVLSSLVAVRKVLEQAPVADGSAPR